MIQIKDILIPTDFSDTSSAALGHASMIAEHFSAQLTILHVDTVTEATREESFPALEPEMDETEKAAEREVLQLTGMKIPQNLSVQRVLRRNEDPAEEIVRYTRDHPVDLAIVGTHGRSGLSHLIMGSVAEKVIRQARCPVITVRACGAAARVTPYLNILAPVDFSPHSEKALLYAWSLAKLFHAQLNILHIVDIPVHPEHYAVNLNLSGEFGHELMVRSHEELERMIAPYQPSNVKYRIVVEFGRAYNEIVEYAAAHESDLVVMGTQGLSGLQKFLLGSTTAKVVRHAPCPVLTVKLGERDFVRGQVKPEVDAQGQGEV